MKTTSPFIRLFSKFLAFKVRILLRARYKVSMSGADLLQSNDPILFLPNHQALIDPIILLSQVFRVSLASPVITERFYRIPVAKWYLKQIGSVSVSDLGAGSRDTEVLNSITRSVIIGFRNNANILIYPGGQIAGQGYEKIYNKKSAYHIVRDIPENVRIVGVRITGLWGSMWSKAKTGKTPGLFVHLLKGMFFILANLLFFVPKRRVTIEFKDLSVQAREMASGGQKSFNTFLEEFYNLHGEEPALFLKHFFYLPQKTREVRQ
jgi:long-chain-fatty-acid--[acyl-carrier-protein] ligase